MPAIASRVFFGVTPPGGVAALKKRARQSSLATVKQAEMSEPSVSRFASVVVLELLSGSSSTLPHPPVTGSTRFGAFPAAILQSERIAGDRFPVDESGSGESRRDGGEFVDDHLGRRGAA